MKTLARLTVLVVLCGAFASASSQVRVDQTPVLSVTTDLVMLPVSVTDRRGRFVPGLRREDFTVYDNGQPQAIEFFMSEQIPATIGLLIDSSTSMRGRRNDVTAAGASFATIGDPLDEYFTLNFNEAVWPGLPSGIEFTSDGGQLRAALAAAPARGMTALYDAIDRGLDHLQRGTRDRRALVVVSDGGDNSSAHTLDEVVDHARRSNAAIYSVTLVDPNTHESNPGVLSRLAHDTGGLAFRPDRQSDVMDAFARVAREIRSGYSLGFSAPNTREGGFRWLHVTVKSPDERSLVVRTRTGYYARASER
jgi:Ca-activated chloride channel family protein